MLDVLYCKLLTDTNHRAASVTAELLVNWKVRVVWLYLWTMF